MELEELAEADKRGDVYGGGGEVKGVDYLKKGEVGLLDIAI